MTKDKKSAAPANSPDNDKADSDSEKQSATPPEETADADALEDETLEAETPEPPPEDPVVALEAEIVAQKDQLLRALAEVENTRRRAERDRQEASRYGAAGLARDLLSVADNLRRALESLPE